MSNLTVNELEKAASSYQEFLVPGLFEVWSGRILDESNIKPEDKMLDVACGTGVLARTAVKRLGDGGNIAGLDINPGMLSVARKMNPDIEWREGLAEDLPWRDDFFDAVFCQFGLMLFEDKYTALREMARVLKLGGKMVVAVFDKLENNACYEVLVKIYDEIAGKEVAQALRTPFSLGDVGKLTSLYDESGLPVPKITTHTVDAHFPDARTLVFADVKGWFPLAGITLGDNQINEIVGKVKQNLNTFVTDNGTMQFPVSAHLIQLSKE